MADSTTAASERPKAPRRSWSAANTRNFIRNYDKSPVTTPPKTPPTLSRNNSSSSIKSTQSEPPRQSQQRHHSEPDLNTGDFNELRNRKSSNASQASAQSTASHKKNSGFKSLFTRHKEKDPLEEMRKKNEKERIVLGSKHAAAVRTKMMTDPNYREFQQKHKKPQVKTAGIQTDNKSRHSLAAEQEMRYPHSGKPAVHAGLDIPMLSRIESHDDPDDEVDQFEARRREWNESKEHDMADIPEMRSRQASPWASPMASRDPSPNRLTGARPAFGSRRNSYAGGYHKDEKTGRWTRKTPPGMTPLGSHVTGNHGPINPEQLAASLAERLNTAA
ncbi:hypothetical protein PMZ80_005362 [Knufia obscura]|uniref:Uncharacterized protein n=2 Tax=Knufia TaxID=430999 RepID=A0AAN8EP76_9EURO|nr:hypothetical protein PMZ80_005362 [Knufia obscura]KAK5958030.1 hypothetical protein OHC33_001220 [Knufia fluminis]